MQRASFSCSFLSSLFVVLSNSTPMPSLRTSSTSNSLHPHHQRQCLPHTSTTTTPSPPTITTLTPTPTSTNATNRRRPTTLGPNDDRGRLGPRSLFFEFSSFFLFFSTNRCFHLLFLDVIYHEMVPRQTHTHTTATSTCSSGG